MRAKHSLYSETSFHTLKLMAECHFAVPIHWKQFFVLNNSIKFNADFICHGDKQNSTEFQVKLGPTLKRKGACSS